jgi:hypothetical protein
MAFNVFNIKIISTNPIPKMSIFPAFTQILCTNTRVHIAGMRQFSLI